MLAARARRPLTAVLQTARCSELCSACRPRRRRKAKVSRSSRPSSPGCARRCGVPRARRPSAPGGRCPDCHISRAQDTGLRQRAIHILWYVAEQHRGGTGAQSGLQTLLEHNSCRQLMLHQRLVLALSDSCDASAGAAAPDHPTQSTTAALASRHADRTNPPRAAPCRRWPRPPHPAGHGYARARSRRQAEPARECGGSPSTPRSSAGAAEHFA